MSLHRTHLISVDGPDAAGKSQLIERLMESNRARFLAYMRLLEDSALLTPRELPADEEVLRIQRAGAEVASRLGVPQRSFPTLDDLREHVEPLLGFHDALLLEGAGRLARYAHLQVFVMRPLPPGEHLVVESREQVHRMDLRELQFHPSDGAVDVDLEESPSLVPGAIVEEDRLLFQIPDDMATLITDAATGGMPVFRELCTLRAGYEGLRLATLVVVNVHDESEWPEAERLVAELEQLFLDGVIQRDGRIATRRLPLFTIACLDDPRDPGTRRAVQRIKRQFRSA